MSERTTEGATPDRAGIEGFFVRYGEAVSAGDLKVISSCYAVPAIVLSDAGSIPISTREEIEAAFDGAAERYRAGDGGRPANRRRGGEPHREAGLCRRAVELPRRARA